jgi:hypothetical protein
MGNTASSGASIISVPSTIPQTPASSFFNNISVPHTKRRIRRSNPPRNNNPSPTLDAYPRRSIFAPDEHEPDDFTPQQEAVLLGWTRTEHGVIIPQIRSLPLGTPLDFDDTILDASPALPWMGHRSRSPVPSARSIPRLRQFSVESLRSMRKRELRVVNVSRPPTPATSIESTYDEQEEELQVCRNRQQSFDWDAFTPPDEGFLPDSPEDECAGDVYLKRGNSTNDSGYSTLVADDTASCSTASEDPWWWEEAAGYKDTSDLRDPTFISHQSVQYLEHQRQESAYISTLLRSQPFDEWTEWRTNVTQLLMIPEEEESESKPPVTPRSVDKPLPDVPKSPSRRRSFFNFAKKTKLEKRRSVLW